MTLPTHNFFDYTIYNISESNQKEILPDSSSHNLVLANSATTADLELLQKIMQAVGKDLKKEVLLLNIDTTEANPLFNQLMAKYENNRTLLIFGFLPPQLGLHLQVKPYQTINWQGWTILFAHSLTQITENTHYKKLLWVQLQQLFAQK